MDSAFRYSALDGAAATAPVLWGVDPAILLLPHLIQLICFPALFILGRQ
jgi:hypothetical protein